MQVLVTGGAGYIGSVTVRDLLDAGHSVVVLDTLEKGWRAAVDPRAKFVRGSVGDPSAVAQALAGCDAVMHLAGYIEVAESILDPERYFENNLTAPLVLLGQMERNGIEVLVFSSSAAVYGQPTHSPITERAETVPVNAYGESKLAFEQEIRRRSALGHLRAASLRYFNAAGAWPDGSLGEAHLPETHLIPRALAALSAGDPSFQVYGDDYDTPDGTCVRDYVHVLDLARAHRIALERLAAGHQGGTWNLGNGRGYTNLEVVQACAEVAGRSIDITIGPRREGDPARLVASCDRARRELQWFAQQSDLRVMVEDAWRWHRTHPHGYGPRPPADGDERPSSAQEG